LFQTDCGTELERVPIKPEDGKVLFARLETGTLITTGKNVVTVWDVWEKKKRTVEFSHVLDIVDAATLSPGGKFLALAGPAREGNPKIQTIVIYRAEGDSFNEWRRLPQNDVERKTDFPMPVEIYLSADGRIVAAHYRDDLTNEVTLIWDIDRGRDVTPASLTKLGNLQMTRLSPTGRFFLADTGQRTQLLDLSKGRMVELLKDERLGSSAFSPDERYLGLGSEEGIAYIFDTDKLFNADMPPDEIARLQHTGKVTAIAFSDDDKYVATASSDHHIYDVEEAESYPLRVWLLQPTNLMTEAKERLKSQHKLSRLDEASGTTYPGPLSTSGTCHHIQTSPPGNQIRND
jgi:hypothetical protein